MTQSFSATMNAWVKETEQRMLAVVQTAALDMVNDMQTPTAKGGRMRVDTGFLRASGRGAIGSMPSGESQRPTDAPVGQYTGIYDDFDGYPLAAVIMDLKLGDTFFFGWTAAYAAARNTYDGFVDIPVQNWQKYVDLASKKVSDDVG
jgi:hypothetical protein